MPKIKSKAISVLDDISDQEEIDLDNLDGDSDNELLTKRQRDVVNTAFSKRKNNESENELAVFNIKSDEDLSDENQEEENDDNSIFDDMYDNTESNRNEEQFDLSERKWTSNKRKFYDTDTITLKAQSESAKEEEEEALRLQKQLAQQLDEDDFSYFMQKITEKKSKSSTKANKNDQTSKKIVPTNQFKTEQISKRDKLLNMRRESPEFFALIEDYQTKMALIKSELYPVIKLHTDSKLSDSDFLTFIYTYRDIILNYSNNIIMYLLLKGKKEDISSHPIIKRLFQYKQLLNQMEPVFKEIIQPQIEMLLMDNTETSDIAMERKLKVKEILKSCMKQEKAESMLEKGMFADDKVGKRKLWNHDEAITSHFSKKFKSDDKDHIENSVQINSNNEVDPKDSKRSAGKDIMANRGLTPYRRKDRRHPRIALRSKYDAALKRRKGAVREIKTETERYGGEIFGMKSNVVRSVKIKS